MSHFLRDANGALQDVATQPIKTETDPSPALPGASHGEFDFGSYELLRRATKIVERMIGAKRTRTTKRGNSLVYRVMGHMKRGETLELEKLRARHGNYSSPSSRKWQRTGGF